MMVLYLFIELVLYCILCLMLLLIFVVVLFIESFVICMFIVRRVNLIIIDDKMLECIVFIKSNIDCK